MTLNYEGGSIEMATGNLTGLFGESAVSDLTKGVTKTVSVKAHSRTRVIGGGSTSIAGGSYTYKQFPSSGNSQAAGGEEVMISWTGSNGWWVARVNGALWKLGEYLDSAAPADVFFKAAGGRTYGPFKATTP
jgi:hypothetical protein